MTPNGAVVFVILLIAGALIARDPVGLAVILTITLIFALGSRRGIFGALVWSAGIVLPLAVFMGLVWIGIVGRAPAELSASLEGARAAASVYVAVICLRLFIIAFAIQAAFLHFAGWTPLRFVGGLTAPAIVKKALGLHLC